MSKKKYRDIHVDGHDYAWLVDKDKNIVVFSNKQRLFSSNAGDVMAITPSLVKERIQNFNTKQGIEEILLDFRDEVEDYLTSHVPIENYQEDFNYKVTVLREQIKQQLNKL